MKKIREVIICEIFLIIEARQSFFKTLTAAFEESPKERGDEDTDEHDGDSFCEKVRLPFSLKNGFFLYRRCDKGNFFPIMKEKVQHLFQ